MISIRKADDRGVTDLGWLDSRHTFAFGRGIPRGDGLDPMGFRGLRVINDDRVAPGMGFDTHAHDNMEIVSYVVEGELAHKDSMGTQETISRGGFQLTSAGSGITHSEFNPSNEHGTRFIQIWIKPGKLDTGPRYDRLDADAVASRNALRLVASPDGQDGSMQIGADAMIWVAFLDENESVLAPVGAGRAGFVQVVRGTVRVMGETLEEGDGLAIEDVEAARIAAQEGGAEILVFGLS
ncbi:MAG: pirin family protein [Phycisphaerales bacterium]